MGTRDVRRRQSGFTLIELMVVVTIIGILCSLSIPMLSKYRDRAKVAAARAFGNQIVSSFAAYAADSPGNTIPNFTTCDEIAQTATEGGFLFTARRQAQFCPAGSAVASTLNPGEVGKLCMCNERLTRDLIYYDCDDVVPPSCSPSILAAPANILVTFPIFEVDDDLHVLASTVTGVEIVPGADLPAAGQSVPMVH